MIIGNHSNDLHLIFVLMSFKNSRDITSELIKILISRVSLKLGFLLACLPVLAVAATKIWHLSAAKASTEEDSSAAIKSQITVAESSMSSTSDIRCFFGCSKVAFIPGYVSHFVLIILSLQSYLQIILARNRISG